jgi:ABC-2 type transport system ATP-binding protein
VKGIPLSVEGVSKSYAKRSVLRDVSFEARGGEILGLVGENGAGKSTLLRIVAGLMQPDCGRVDVNGRLGYCDQDPHVFADLTVAEHFLYFARAYGIADGGDWAGQRDELMEWFRYTREVNSRAGQLSGGTRQKLHLSLALLHRPQVLVLDEPYQAFDWQTYLLFWARAEALREAGTAIIVVSHIAHDRERFTRILELREGRLQ